MYALKIVFSDNLTNSFTIQEIDDCQCVIMKEMKVLVFLIIFSDCQQPHQHIHLKEKKTVSWYTNLKILYLKSNFY